MSKRKKDSSAYRFRECKIKCVSYQTTYALYFYLKVQYTIGKDEKKDEYSTYGTKKKQKHQRGSNRQGNFRTVPATEQGGYAGGNQGYFWPYV